MLINVHPSTIYDILIQEIPGTYEEAEAILDPIILKMSEFGLLEADAYQLVRLATGEEAT